MDHHRCDDCCDRGGVLSRCRACEFMLHARHASIAVHESNDPNERAHLWERAAELWARAALAAYRQRGGGKDRSSG